MAVSMATLTLRPARQTDATTISRVQVDACQQAYRSIVPDEVLDRPPLEPCIRYWGDAIAAGQPEVTVAERQDELVGWLALGPCRDRAVAADAGEVWALYVIPAHWSTGVGQALWRQACSNAADRAYRSLSVWVLADNLRGRRFYEEMGMQRDPDRTQSTMHGERRLREVRYLWFRRDRQA